MEFKLFDSLGFHIGSTAKLLHIAINKAFQQHGINIRSEHWILLIRLWESDGVTQKTLCDNCKTDKVSTTRALDHLESLEYIERRFDKEDRRNKRIFLTKKGKESKTLLFQTVGTFLRDISVGIPEGEIKQLKVTLSQLRQNLLQHLDNDPLTFPFNKL